MNHRRLGSGAVAGVILLVAGCPGSEIANPSGNCGTRSDGARAGYHAPGDATWVPDCGNPLLREYWRAFTEDGRSGYLMPRPDGAPELQPICSDPQHALRSLVERYPLCTAATSSEQAAAVNAMDLADALTLVHFLHGQLRFVTTPTARGIDPFPIPSDIIAACTLGAEVNSAELETICARERDRLHTGQTLAFSYTGAGAEQLVARLNALYGIQ